MCSKCPIAAGRFLVHLTGVRMTHTYIPAATALTFVFVILELDKTNQVSTRGRIRVENEETYIPVKRIISPPSIRPSTKQVPWT